MRKNLKFLLLFLTLGLAFTSCKKEASVAQEDLTPVHEMGLIFLPADEYARIPVAPLPDNIDLKALPTAASLVTPPVGDQGSEGSCVAWGTTYAGRSIDWHAKTGGAYDYTVNVFSPEYVYNQVKVSSSCASGAYITAGLNLLQSQGVCRWSLMPYVNGDCSTLPNSVQKTDAGYYKIAGYSTATISTSYLKAQIVAGKPVIVGGPVNRAFESLPSGGVLGAFKKPSLGGHCYCIVGYDDAKNAFKFQNSWGPNWSSSGFGWIDYKFITQWWTEAYIIN